MKSPYKRPNYWPKYKKCWILSNEKAINYQNISGKFIKFVIYYFLPNLEEI